MTKRHNAKYKIDRRLGVNLWGRPKSPFNRRNSKPGQHGVQGQRKKLSDYGNQLFAKQKLKFYYGDLTERQFRNIFKKASNIKGDTSQILIELLERRLDATVYRMKFVPTIFSARQLVNHGHVTVNGHVLDIASYQCKAGDVVAIRERKGSKKLAEANLEFPGLANVPPHIELDKAKMSAKIISKCEREWVALEINELLVVEYYSRKV